MSKMGSIWTSKNFLTTETTSNHQLEIIVFHQNMQDKKKLINKSQDNEFGDKK